MCGISGIFNFRTSVSEARIDAFNKALKHRGPDVQHHFMSEDRSLALGHCRLSIVDLSEGANQPFHSLDQRYSLTFNGEIYNYPELRRELEDQGYTFKTDSDTEVLLNAYIAWGPHCQKKFNGMWAFAIWDNYRRELFLSRDRFGVKSLYFSYLDGEFAFASEQKAFTELWGSLNISRTQAVMAVSFPEAIETQRETLYENIKKLLPGECAFIVRNEIKIERWWNTYEEIQQAPDDYGSVENLISLFSSACEIRTRTDVNIATSLSGGLDSSAVTAKIAGFPDLKKTKELRAYIGSFADTEYDEFKWGKCVVDASDIPFERVKISSNDAVSLIQPSCEAMEDINRLPAIGQWRIYDNMKRDGYKVSLEGHAGDELLAGYVRYYKDYLGDIISSRQSCHELATAIKLFSEVDLKFSQKSQLIGHMLQTPLDNDELLNRFKYRTNPAVLAHLNCTPQIEFNNDIVKERALPGFQEEGLLFQRLYEDFHYYSLPNILKNFDRLSMANSIEIRSPFLDYRFVVASFKAEKSLKISADGSKSLIRKHFDFIPETVRQRKDKLGFNPPVTSWLKNAFGIWLKDIIHDPSFLNSDLINGKSLSLFINDCLNAGKVEKIVPYWPVINLFLLERKYS